MPRASPPERLTRRAARRRRAALTTTLLIVSSFAVAYPEASAAEHVRYYAIWSYTQNAPSNELAETELAERELGYWKLRFDGAGQVSSAAYHSSEGTLWLSIRYVADGGHIYADVYNAQGQFVVRKSTQLSSREPN